MGDRANAVVLGWPTEKEEDRGAVFLYTHWGGSELPETVRKALDSEVGRGRWDDHAYLARIVFDVLTDGNHGAETGFGISTTPPDNEYGFIVLDPDAQRVIVVHAPDWKATGFVGLNQYDSISFEDYVAKERNWDNLTAP